MRVQPVTFGLAGLWVAMTPLVAQPTLQLELLDVAALKGGGRIEGSLVGGLSGLTYDRKRELFYAVSDSATGRARFYSLRIELQGSPVELGEIEVVSVTPLLDFDRQPFAELSVDPEAIALAPNDTLWVASEGQIRRQIDPFLRQFRIDGSPVRELSLPAGTRASLDSSSGPRHNLAFESVAISPDGAWLFTATENALIQDGPTADLQVSSPVRLYRFAAASGRLDAVWRYEVDPIPAAPDPADGFNVSGLVELAAMDSRTLLALERSYVTGVGHGARLYQVSLDRVQLDTREQESIQKLPLAAKELIIDLERLGVPLDNLEGMSFGPELPDGRRTLLLVSDDNFNVDSQVTQILVFAVAE